MALTKKRRIALATLTACLIYLVVDCIRRPWWFQRFTHGKIVHETWTAKIDHRPEEIAEKFFYSLVNASGKSQEIDRRRKDDLKFAAFSRNGKRFVVTKSKGEGSSGADYYTVIELKSDTLAFIPASEKQSAYLENSEECLSQMKPVEVKEPNNIFGSCCRPYINGNEQIVFEMKGFHCSIFQFGGCQSVELVSLK